MEDLQSMLRQCNLQADEMARASKPLAIARNSLRVEYPERVRGQLV